MGATIIVNGRTVVHKDSGGKAPSVPDFCKTLTPPGPPVPIPYVNIAQSTDTDDGSEKVKMNGNPIMLKTSKFSTSKGDEAGTVKGVASSTTSGIAKFVNYSFDVKVEGKNVPRLGDPMTNNGNGPNTTTVAELQKTTGVTEINLTNDEVEHLCQLICSCRETIRRQECVAESYSSGWPMYQDETPNGSPLCEVTYDQSTLPSSLLKSTNIPPRITNGGAIHPSHAAASMNQARNFIGQGNTVRWDHVFPIDPSQPADLSNVRQIVEIKFKKSDGSLDDLTDAQQNAIADDDDEKILVVTEDDCKCKD